METAKGRAWRKNCVYSRKYADGYDRIDWRKKMRSVEDVLKEIDAFVEDMSPNNFRMHVVGFYEEDGMKWSVDFGGFYDPSGPKRAFGHGASRGDVLATCMSEAFEELQSDMREALGGAK